MPTSVVRTINSRNKGETVIAMLRRGQARGRSAAANRECETRFLSMKRMPWATPAGAQTARPGGATQEPASVQTVINPAET